MAMPTNSDSLPKTTNNSNLLTPSSYDKVKSFIVLAMTIWIGRFWNFASFGLYEDDYYRIPRAMGMSGSELGNSILSFFWSENQGRPLHPIFIYLFSFLGSKLGGLHAIHLLGYTIVTLNSFLFYILLRQLSTQPIFAITGALTFCLFPANTAQPFLTHTLGLQPSLMFLLIAFYCYLAKRKKLSYFIIVGSLLCYETVFLVFLAAPLLQKKWNSRLIQELFRHALVLGGMLVCMVIIRKISGESRVASINLLSDEIPRRMLSQMFVGSTMAMQTFVSRFFETLFDLKGLNKKLLVLLFLYFVGLVWVLSSLKFKISNNAFSRTILVKSRIFCLRIPLFLKNFVKLALLGLIMLVLAYPLTFAFQFNAQSGAGAGSLHLAATVGASILCACLCSAILFVAHTYGQKLLPTVGLSAYFALLVGFGLITQQDYVKGWEYQQAFWTDAIALCPDVTDGTVILLEPTGLRRTREIDSQSWSIPLVFNQIYKFPDDWKILPRVYRLKPDWQEKIILGEENVFDLNSSTRWMPSFIIDGQGFPSLYWKEKIVSEKNLIVKTTVASTNVILLETKDGQLTRKTEPLIIGEREFPLKEKSASRLPPFDKGSLYDYLIRASDEESIKYLRRRIQT
jgi:hypothetical protein